MYFGLTEYFTDEVDRALYLVDVARLVSFDDQDCAHHMSGGSYVEVKDLPIVECGQDGWGREEFIEILECPRSFLIPLELVKLLEKFEERHAPLTESADEPAQGCHAPG